MSAIQQTSAELQNKEVRILFRNPNNARTLLRFGNLFAQARETSPKLAWLDMDDPTDERMRLILDSTAYSTPAEAPKGGASPFFLTDWSSSPQTMSRFLRLARDKKAQLAVLRHSHETPIRSILVVLARGANSASVIESALLLGRAMGVPARALHVIQPEAGGNEDGTTAGGAGRRADAEAEISLHLRMAGAEFPLEIREERDVAEAVKQAAVETDLVLMGGSKNWGTRYCMANSLPNRVAQTISLPLMVVYDFHQNRNHLAHLFWENTIRTNVKAESKESLIPDLINTLVAAGQIPPALKPSILKVILKRENHLSTYVSNGIAIPHGSIPECAGIFAVLAICPEGVVFGTKGERAHFVFLILSDRNNYPDYLKILAEIAALMHRETARKSLLEAPTPREAARVIQSMRGPGQAGAPAS